MLIPYPSFLSGLRSLIAMLLCLSQWVPLAAQAPPSATPEQLEHEANILIERKQWLPAEQTLRTLLGQRPAAATPHFLLGFVLFHQARFTDSLAAYTAGARLRSPTQEDLLIVASDYIQLKDYTDAERWLIYVTTHQPANPLAWYLLGRTQYLLDHASAAASSFEHSLTLTPKDVRAEYNLGLAYERMQRPEEAIAAYRTAISWASEASQPDPQPYLDLGSLLLELNRPGEALLPLQQSARLAPRNPMAQQQLGAALEKNGQDQAAIAAYRRAIELAPEAEHPHFFLGRLLRRLGQKTEAEQQFAIVARLLAGASGKETPNIETPLRLMH